MCITLGLKNAYMFAQDILLVMTSRVYVVNAKAKGKVHLSVGQAQKGKHRVKCGWYITSSTSLVFGCNRLKYGELCRRCFKDDDIEKPPEENEEVEQFDDEF